MQGVAQRNLRTQENDLLGPAGFNILPSQENDADGWGHQQQMILIMGNTTNGVEGEIIVN